MNKCSPGILVACARTYPRMIPIPAGISTSRVLVCEVARMKSRPDETRLRSLHFMSEAMAIHFPLPMVPACRHQLMRIISLSGRWKKLISDKINMARGDVRA